MRQTHVTQQTNGRAISSGRQIAGRRRAAALGHAAQQTCAALIERLEERRLLASGLASVLVADLNATGDTSITSMVEYMGGVVFDGNNGNGLGQEVWRSDGTAAGTVLVKDTWTGWMGGLFFDTVFTNINGTLFFYADDHGRFGRELWKSDGTTAGTVVVKDINPGTANADTFGDIQAKVGNTLYFVADDGVHGSELWKTDGTTAGTVLVEDIYPGTSASSIQTLTNVNGKLYFVANDGTHGEEIWTSDGTAAGTVILKDIYAGSGSGLSFQQSSLVNVNGTLYFTANDGTHGAELWKSDGTAAGTIMVKDIFPGMLSGTFFVSPMTAINGTVFFYANDGVRGRELWKSDGTAAGTSLLKDVNPTGDAEWHAGMHAQVGDTLYFTADDGVHGQELWKTDGTPEGTVLVKDIRPGSTASSIKSLTNVAGKLLFTADDGTHGPELWISDGTTAGTTMVEDLQPSGEWQAPHDLTAVGGRLFYAARDATHGWELRMVVIDDTAPIAQAGGPYEVGEGGSIQLSGAASSDAEGRIAAYQWDFSYDGETFGVDATGVAPTFAAGSLDGPGVRTVALRVQDSAGTWSQITTATVSITNAAPTARFASAGAVALGQSGSVTFSNATDPSAADVAAGFRFSYDFDNDGTFEITDSLQATATVPASHLMTLGGHTIAGRITDKDGGSRSYTTTLTVTPPPDTQVPTATAQVANLSSYGRSHSFTVTYRDNELVRRSTIDSLDIGVSNSSGFDAPARLVGVSSSGNAATITATYAIDGPGGSWDAADNGNYSIRLQSNQVADASGNFAAAWVLGSFTSAVLAFDVPGVLQIDGTDAKDTILISSSGGGSVSVTHNGTTRSYVQVTGLLVLALGGDDVVTLDPFVTLPATIKGGAGNDQITGGSATDSLKGGGGNDTLLGKAGSDTLNGGGGADRIVGGGGNDRLIGGAGNDVIRGGAGNDTLIGLGGNDQLSGGGGNDLLAARDSLIDTVSGGGGRDTLEGDNGLDQLLTTDIEVLV